MTFTNDKFYRKFNHGLLAKVTVYSTLIFLAIMSWIWIHKMPIEIVIVAGEIGIFVVLFPMYLMLMMHHYTVKDGTIRYYDLNRKTTELMSDINAVIISNGGRTKGFEYAKTSSGKTIPRPFVALCSGDVSDFKTKGMREELNVFNMYSYIKDTGALTVHNLEFSKDLAEFLTTEFTGDLFISRSVYEACEKEISEYYQKWTKENKTIYIIEDKVRA